MVDKDHFDSIVIGAGQGGVPLATDLATAGNRTALVERKAVGGTCVNTGCTPTKTMVHIAKVAQVVRRALEYGVHSSEPKVDMRKVRDLKRAIVEDFRSSGEKGLLETKNLDLVYGQAKFVGPKQLQIALKSGGSRTVSADRVFINTGCRPAIPDIDGIQDVPFLDSTSIMELDEIPDSLLILGGGSIGLEFGQMFARFGSKVTIIEQGKNFLPHEDRDIAEEVLDILKEDGIEVHVGVSAKRVSSLKGKVSLELDGNTIGGSHLLVAAGRRPNTDDLGAEAGGIDLDEHGFIKVDRKLRTSQKGVFALGDVKGGPAFTHISYDDYRILKANLLDGGRRSTDDRLLPYCMFIDPQLGRIGMSETEAKQKGGAFRVCKMNMSHVARALEMNESRGFIKALVCKETDKILGAAVLGVEGGEIMSMIELAMMGGLTSKKLQAGVFAHPTLSELLNNLFS